MARIKEDRDKRLFVAETFREYETQCAKEDFEREKSLAETEFEVYKIRASYKAISQCCVCVCVCVCVHASACLPACCMRGCGCGCGCVHLPMSKHLCRVWNILPW